MTDYTLTLKFKSKDDLKQVVGSGQQILLARDVAVDAAKPGDQATMEPAYRVAWTVFEPRMTATLTWTGAYSLYAAEVDPNEAAGPNGPQTYPWGVYMLSPTAADLGASYAFKQGAFTRVKPANGANQPAVQVQNGYQAASWLSFGLAQKIAANGFDLPPLPYPDAGPNGHPIVIQKVASNASARLTPTPGVHVALSKTAAVGQVLGGLPDDALTLPFGPNKTSFTATYDPDSKAFKLDQGTQTDGDGDGGSDADAAASAGLRSGADRPAPVQTVPETAPHCPASVGPGPTRTETPTPAGGPGHPATPPASPNANRQETDMSADTPTDPTAAAGSKDQIVARAWIVSSTIPDLAHAAQMINQMIKRNYTDMSAHTHGSHDRRTIEVHVVRKHAGNGSGGHKGNDGNNGNNGDKTVPESDKPFVRNLETVQHNFIQASIMAGLGEAGAHPHSFWIEYFD